MSRIDNLKLQNKKYDISLIDSLSMVDPSDQYTYSEFLLKQIKEKISGNNIEFNNRIKDWRRELENWYSLPSDNIKNMSNLYVSIEEQNDILNIQETITPIENIQRA